MRYDRESTVQFFWIIMIMIVSAPLVVGYAASTTTPSSGWLHTEGRWIKDQQGNIQGLYGANSYVWLENYQPKFAAAKAYGFNTIRLGLVKYDFDHPGSLDQWADHTGLAALDRAVGWSRDLGLRIILSQIHWGLYNGVDTCWPAPGEFLSDTSLQTQWLNMWRLLVDRYKNDPTVIGIDLMNEPYTMQYNSDNCPGGKGISVSNPWLVWEGIAKNAVADLKTHNPNLLFIIEDWTTPHQWSDVAFLKQPNIVWSDHHYYRGNTWSDWAKAYSSGNLAAGKQLLAKFVDDNYMAYINQGVAYWEAEVGFVTTDPYWQQEMTDRLLLFDQRGISYAAYTFAAWPWSEQFDLTVSQELNYSLATVGHLFSDHLLGLQSPTTSTTTTSSTTSTTSSTGITTTTTTLKVKRRTTMTSTNSTTSTT